MVNKDTYTEDLSFDLKHPDAPAVFLPSLGPVYVRYASNYQKYLSGDKAARLPAGIHEDGRELNFMREDSANYYWPYALYSAGHANLNIDRKDLDSVESMLRKRDPKKTILIGDSGGYQIGKGVLEFDWKNFDGKANNDLRMKILRWLEATADYSMTLDVPVWGIGNSKMGIESFEDCLNKTLYNHNFFIKHRKEGATKFLNVLHGRNMEEADVWWDKVKDLPFEGWAAAGMNMKDFEIILRRLIIMRDGDYLDDNRSWIHYLGISRLTTSCAFSAIQRALRRHVNPNMTISYDASSPYYSTAKARLYTRMTYSRKSINYSLDTAVDSKDLKGSNLPFPILSPIGRKLKMGDICVKGHDIDSKSSWDAHSYLYLMSHNCYMHIKGIMEANNLYSMPRKNAEEWVPGDLLEFRDLVEEVFTSERPFDLIKENHRLLNNLSGLKLDDKKLSTFATNGLFAMEDSAEGVDAEEENFSDENIEDAA